MSRLLRCRVVCALALLAALLLVQTAPAAGLLQPPAGKQNQVYIKMQLLALSTIDGVTQTFTMEFFLLTIWSAPLPANSTLSCETISTCSSISASDIGSTFWQPSLQFLNSRGDTIAVKDEPYSLIPGPSFAVSESLPDGWVWVQSDQRYEVDFASEMRMNAFPFDIQHLQMEIESSWRSDQVALNYATPNNIDAIAAEMSSQTIGWDFMDSGLSTRNQTYSYNGGSFPTMTYTTTWKRQPQYYLYKIVIGMMLLVWMCIWTFSLQIDVSDRMMGTLQVFTGLISFLFVASGDTPQLPYQTRLDVFMLYSFFIIAVIMFLHGALYFFREQGFSGSKLDRLEFVEAQKRRELLAKAKKFKRKIGTVAPEEGDGQMQAIGDGETAPTKEDGNAGIEMAKEKPHLRARSTARLDDAGAGDEVSVRPAVDRLGSHSGVGPESLSAQDQHLAVETAEDDGWEVRLHDWRDWSLVSWFAALACTRKWDAILVPLLFLVYTIGTAVILGRPASDGTNA